MVKTLPMSFGLTEEQEAILVKEAKLTASHALAIRGDVYSCRIEMETAWDAEYMVALTRFKASDNIEGIIQGHLERAGQTFSIPKPQTIDDYTTRNTSPAYGLTTEDMKCFRAKTEDNTTLDNEQVLENIYYGMHNIDVPHSILELMNTAAILALYAGAGILKRDNRHKTEPVEYGNAEDLISILFNHGFPYKAVNVMKRRGFTEHKGLMRKRMALVSNADKQAFIESFEADYVPSLRESEACGGFRDDSQPSESERGKLPEAVIARNIKSRYIRMIYESLEQIYMHNTSQ